jgi:hypothetical protein
MHQHHVEELNAMYLHITCNISSNTCNAYWCYKKKSTKNFLILEAKENKILKASTKVVGDDKLRDVVACLLIFQNAACLEVSWGIWYLYLCGNVQVSEL